MNQFKYRWVLYFISGVILTTLCIQVYWNYKNYQLGKQQLINDVQSSLDNTVDKYYAQLATEESIEIIKDSVEINLRHAGSFNSKNDSIRIVINDSKKEITSQSIFGDECPGGVTMIKTQNVDSITSVFVIKDSLGSVHSDSIRMYFDKISEPVEWLSSKIILSLAENSLSLSKIDSLFKRELGRKKISIDYGLSYKGPFDKPQELRSDVIKRAKLQTVSTSPFFINQNSLTVHFSNIMVAILKKNIFGILLSFILVSTVIGCLLYLLAIIRHQKQLAEVKNDLISNITHEFKTPIATIGAAMEGILAFNNKNDPVKNLRYAKISSEQVEKLNGMVEKLLETATLDSEDLDLQLETINLVELLRKAATKEIIALKNKVIQFESSEENIIAQVDIFHFENAINNCIDNAIKYGGDEISVAIKNSKNNIEITISDTGTSLSEEHKKQVFEKFYRVPKGNTHDVKGFGIGLYYSKKIIEKHQGTITLVTNGHTSFKIQLPNA